MPTNASKIFRTRLREQREERGLTQYQAAERCGIGQKLYQAYEIGIKDNPGLKTLQRIADGFGIGVHELLIPESPSGRKRRTDGKQ